MKPRSLRARLVATMLLLLAVASAVIALVTTLTLQQFLIGRLDSDPARDQRPVPAVPPHPGRAARSGNTGPRPPDSLLVRSKRAR